MSGEDEHAVPVPEWPGMSAVPVPECLAVNMRCLSRTVAPFPGLFGLFAGLFPECPGLLDGVEGNCLRVLRQR